MKLSLVLFLIFSNSAFSFFNWKSDGFQINPNNLEKTSYKTGDQVLFSGEICKRDVGIQFSFFKNIRNFVREFEMEKLK